MGGLMISRIWMFLVCAVVGAHSASAETLPNNFPFLNHAGTAATFSTDGFVDLDNAFHSRVGANGRTCESCHLPQAGWSIRPIDVELLFLLTRGNDPIFNPLDANNPQPDVSTLQAKYRSYSMLRRGLFRRGGNLPADAEFEIEAVSDPLNTGASPTRFEFFRRPLATANFHIAKNIGWHDQNTNGSGDVAAGLFTQATGAINGALGGPPAAPEVVQSIVTYEATLGFAQQTIFGIGRLDNCGARGGAETHATQPSVAGRFTLFDAWIDMVPGSCTTERADRKRAQIARGQEIFNQPNRGGGSCLGCHNASNNGSHTNGVLFDIGASRPEFAVAGMPVYTLRNKVTGDRRQTTDPGRAVRSGKWADVDRFKVPSLRGLAARPPYFHNGIAPTLKDVVIHYEVARGFQYTQQEREDLVAFLEAL
jgi:cytochrome c peroxidase